MSAYNCSWICWAEACFWEKLLAVLLLGCLCLGGLVLQETGLLMCYFWSVCRVSWLRLWDFVHEERHRLGMRCGYVCKCVFLCSQARVHKTPYVILPRTPPLICSAQTWLHRGLLLCFINMCPCCLIPVGSVSKNRMDNKPSILSLCLFFFPSWTSWGSPPPPPFSFPKNLKHFCGSLVMIPRLKQSA